MVHLPCPKEIFHLWWSVGNLIFPSVVYLKHIIFCDLLEVFIICHDLLEISDIPWTIKWFCLIYYCCLTLPTLSMLDQCLFHIEQCTKHLTNRHLMYTWYFSWIFKSHTCLCIMLILSLSNILQIFQFL